MKITFVSFLPFFFAILHSFPYHIGLQTVGSALTITVPTDTMNAAATAVVLIDNATMRQIIIETLGTGPSVEPVGVPVLPVAALEGAPPGPAQAVAGPSRGAAAPAETAAVLQESQAEQQHREQWCIIVHEAEAPVVLRLQRLGTSPVPGNLLLWPVWSIGIYTGRKEADVEKGHTTTVAVDRRTLRNHTIRHRKGWRVRPRGQHVPAAHRDPAVAPPALTRSVAPAAAEVAGKSFACH